MNTKRTILAIFIPALLCAACENPVVQEILRVPATVSALHISAETLDGSVYKPAGNINYGLSPAFTPEHMDYNAWVPESTGRITVTAAPWKDGTVQYQEEGGPVQNTGVFDFTGKQSVLIYVTVNRKYMDAAVYTILVKRKQPAWLEDLRVTSDKTGAAPQPLNPGFSADTLVYTVFVPSSASKIKVEGTVKSGVEVSFKQDDGSFADPPFTADDTNRDFSSGDLVFSDDSISIAVRVFLPSPPNPEPDPAPLVYTLLVERPGRVTLSAGQENNFILGESAAEYHYYKEGEAVAFTVKSPFGYAVDRVSYTPEGGEAVTINPSGGVYAFIMPRGNISLKGEWAPASPAPNVLYVRGIRNGETRVGILAEKTANGNDDSGSSWANASLDLQDVMDNKWDAGKEIWISEGKVTPDWSTVTPGSGWASDLNTAQVTDKRNSGFILREGIKIYGGFEGTETTRPAELPQNKTVLSGDHGTEGNSSHVLVAVGINQPTLVESLTISGGCGIFSAGSLKIQGETLLGNHGGGVYTNSCGQDLVFRNVTIIGNIATNGGGMNNENSGPTLEGVAITGNMATNGGGMYNDKQSSPLLTGGTSVSGNDATSGSGGMYNNEASPVLENVRINNNISNGTGGVENNKSVFTATDVEINGNQSLAGGTGGVYNSSSNFTGTNVVISDNRSAGGRAGGMFNLDTHVSLSNARITGNETGSTGSTVNSESAGGIGGDYFDPNPGNNFYITLVNVEISGNKSAGTAGGLYAQGIHVTLTNVTISGNEAGPAGGGGIYFDPFGKKLEIRNSVIWKNGGTAENIKYSSPPSSTSIVEFKNTLVERPAGDGGGGIVTGAYNAAAEPFAGSADDIFAGPLPSSVPATAALGAYQLKPGSVAINKGDNSLYIDVPGLSGISPGDTNPTLPSIGPGLGEDFAGNVRPKGAVDLGAYEK